MPSPHAEGDICHIRVAGAALCQCEAHDRGLIGPRSPLPAAYQRCGYPERLVARRAADALTARGAAHVTVLPSPCPYGPQPGERMER